MNKKIAIPTQKGKLSKGISDDTTFNMFELKDGRVMQVEQEKPKKINVNYTSLWLRYKNVTELYIDEITKELKEKLNKLGIIVKQKEDLIDDTFFNQFIFD